MEQKTCKQCNQEFEITNVDLEFYKKVSPTFDGPEGATSEGKQYLIPPPTLCPECRWRRRITFRNERELYKRKCDLSGKDILSMYPPDVPFPVYYITEWFSDKWNPMDYGKDFDFSKTFFEQFKNLSNKVPRFHAYIDPLVQENSEYTNCAIGMKNCYLVSQATDCEDCYYSRGIHNSKDCCDCLRTNKSELCYECVNAFNDFRCFFCQDCSNCSDCYFSSDLRGCKNCFGCHSLQQKQYYIFNKSVSKEQWEAFAKKNFSFTNNSIEEFKRKSYEIRMQVPHRFAHLLKCENCTGDHLVESKNATACFDSRELENCNYCYEMTLGAKDCHDFSMTGKDCEIVYEAMGCGYSTKNCAFITNCRQNVSGLYYCDSCFPQVNNCFGCIGLKNSEYCILNKQYSKEEYEKLVAKIIGHMNKTNEWGEFFPVGLSPFSYNKTLAFDYFPISKDEASQNNLKWQDKDQFTYSGEFEIPNPDISFYKENTQEVGKILTGVLKCKITGRPFKINPQELAFYIHNDLPIPDKHYETRYQERIARRNPRRLWRRKCMNGGCNNKFETTYAPDRPERVFCEKCYQKEMT